MGVWERLGGGEIDFSTRQGIAKFYSKTSMWDEGCWGNLIWEIRFSTYNALRFKQVKGFPENKFLGRWSYYMHHLGTSAFIDNENVGSRVSQPTLSHFHAYRMFVSLHSFMAFLRKVNPFSHLLSCTSCLGASVHIRCASYFLNGLGMLTCTHGLGLNFYLL